MNGFTIWLTGMPGSGKSTLACRIGAVLEHRGHRVEILDGDDVRRHINSSLGYSKEDRDTNVRGIGFVGRLLSRNGIVAIVAAISPYRETRDDIRHRHESPFIEVFVDCKLEELARRDPKGLYAKAARGELQNLTGVSDPYEPPVNQEVTVHTDVETIDESVDQVLRWLELNALSHNGSVRDRRSRGEQYSGAM